jgi:putative transposase
MPRGARIIADNSYYHIITRGIDQRKLFRYSCDYQNFKMILLDYLEKLPLSILNYCLMPNHIHFLVYVKDGGMLPKFMQGVLQVYAFRYREKYKSAGFVFQNRYKSKIIEKVSYLLECARYIERNPLRANIVEDLFDYPWSSFHFYAAEKKDPLVKEMNPLYLELSPLKEIRRQQYLNFILNPRGAYEDIIDKEFRTR